MQSIAQRLQSSVLIFDGAMGTELYRRGVFVNRSFEEACLSQADLVRTIHREYLGAGADVLTTNSYGASSSKLARFGLAERASELSAAAVTLARSVAQEVDRPILIAGSIGPLEGPDDDAPARIEELAAQVVSMAGADFLLFETLPHRRAAVEALLAAEKAATSLPVVLSFAVDSEKTSSHGEPLSVLLAPFQTAVKPSALGFNCGGGPDMLLWVLEEAIRLTNLPLIVRPNGGQPRSIEGRQIPLCSPEYFTSYGRRAVELGARGIGGCCGIGPNHIKELALAVKPLTRTAAAQPKIQEAKEEAAKPQAEIPLAQRSALGQRLVSREWIQTVEILPPRGFDLSDTIAKAAKCKAAGIHAINLPDGPRASARISPLITALKIQEGAGIETILHVCARDRNLIGLQAELLGCAASKVANLLFITGDPPKLGAYQAITSVTGVFDADAIGLVAMQKNLNQGLDLGHQSLGTPTAAVIGVGTDPNALDLEKEAARMKKKVEAGAEFVITQPVFDPASLLSFLERLEKLGLNLPVLAGIWPLASLRNALFMKHEVPGVVVPDALIARMEKFPGRDDQRRVGIEIAREMLAAVRPRLSGVQVSAPLGNVQTALEVLK
jgi:homocysteine S-methyltransferase